MLCLCNLRNQYVISRTNKNKLPFLNRQHTWKILWSCRFGKLIQHYWYFLAEVICSKNSGQRNQMAVEVIWNSKRIIPLPSASLTKFWPESLKKHKLKCYFSCSTFIIFYSTIDWYMRCVSYLWQHMRVVSVCRMGTQVYNWFRHIAYEAKYRISLNNIRGH